MPTSNIGPETLARVEAVCEEAYVVLEAVTSSISPAEAHEIRSRMAVRVMAAVADGERNLEELKVIALNLRQALILA